MQSREARSACNLVLSRIEAFCVEIPYKIKPGEDCVHVWSGPSFRILEEAYRVLGCPTKARPLSRDTRRFLSHPQKVTSHGLVRR